MGLTLRQVGDWFVDDDEDAETLDPDTLETASGKDESNDE